MLLCSENFKPLASRAPYKNCPAATFYFFCCIRKLLVEGIVAAKVTFNLLQQLTIRLSTTIWTHNIPEDRMQIMACTIKCQLSLPMLHKIKIARLSGFLKLFLGSIKAVYIRFMMLVMMDAHRFFINVGLEGVIRIGKWRQSVSPDRYGLVRYSRIVIGWCGIARSLV
ncbi:hypothetical protein D3C78_1266240 [compost metagenome]